MKTSPNLPEGEELVCHRKLFRTFVGSVTLD